MKAGGMRAFRRQLQPLTTPGLLRRLRWASFGAVVLAGLDTLGVVLVLPLIQLVTTLDSEAQLAWPASAIADAVGPDDLGRVTLAVALAVITAFILKGIAALVLLRFTIRTATDAEADMAARLVDAYLHAPFQFHLRHNSADLQGTIHDSLRRIYQDGVAFLVPATADQLVILAIGMSLVVMAPVETMVGAFALGVIAFGYRSVTGARARVSSNEMIDHIRLSFRLTQQALSSIKEITTSGTADRFAAQIVSVRRDFGERQSVLTLTEQLPRYYLELGLIGGTAAVAGVSFGLHDTDRALTVLGVFMVAGFRVLPSLNRLLNAANKADIALPHLHTVRQFYDEARVGTVDVPDRLALPSHRTVDVVRFEHVSFAYDAGVPVLDDVDIELRRSEMVAIVGGSGAGKTTFVNLLLGLLDPTDGGLTVDGQPLVDCRRSWQHRLGYVPQDVVVFDSSILENIAFGDPAPDEARIWNALTSARLDDVVREMPAGLETVVGEAGSRISGGQRQRLGLARALYQRPEFLVLDEATSSLDTETEARVLDTLDGLRRDTTILVVAHRLSTVRTCDRIIVLAGGRVEATGTYDDLVRSSPTFGGLAAAADRARLPT